MLSLTYRKDLDRVQEFTLLFLLDYTICFLVFITQKWPNSPIFRSQFWHKVVSPNNLIMHCFCPMLKLMLPIHIDKNMNFASCNLDSIYVSLNKIHEKQNLQNYRKSSQIVMRRAVTQTMRDKSEMCDNF